MHTIKKSIIIIAFAMLSTILSTNTYASEGGGSSYPNGAESIMAGAIPAPGFYFLNYLTLYSSDKLVDNDGDEVPVELDLDVRANVFRFVYVSKKQFLGGFIGVHTLIPIVDMDIEIMGQKDSDSGLGDITLGTNLSWHSKNWHFAAGLDVTAPTGNYDKDELANIGRNYYTIEPVLGFTYLSDGGYEASVKAMYDYNTENNDTDYQTGQELHFDYFTGLHFAKNWVVGLSGYYYKQITDDEVNEEKVSDNQGQVLAFGPAVQYQYKNMSFIGKYQQETMVRNRTKGNKFWFKFIYAF